MKLLILKGLPGSGKSAWARKFCEENTNWVRVNRDDLRDMRGKYWVPKQEKLITKWENKCIISAFEMGYSVILDATNLNDDRNRNRIEELRLLGFEFSTEVRLFDTSLKECIRRDLIRSNSVGEDVIRNMHDKYLAPPPVVYNEERSLREAVIFDIDGTLAIMGDRKPYDWDRVMEDSVNRDGSGRQLTEEWLNENGIQRDLLCMREAGNTEKDSVVKKRMFEENIRGQYFVKFVVDDRDQVVDMWRKELGLTCLQVNYGNF